MAWTGSAWVLLSFSLFTVRHPGADPGTTILKLGIGKKRVTTSCSWKIEPLQSDMSGGGEILPLVMTKSPKEAASSGLFARTTSCITDPQVSERRLLERESYKRLWNLKTRQMPLSKVMCERHVLPIQCFPDVWSKVSFSKNWPYKREDITSGHF